MIDKIFISGAFSPLLEVILVGFCEINLFLTVTFGATHRTRMRFLYLNLVFIMMFLIKRNSGAKLGTG